MGAPPRPRGGSASDGSTDGPTDGAASDPGSGHASPSREPGGTTAAGEAAAPMPRTGGRPRAEVLGPASGPWFTFGMGGALLAQSAALFYGIVALVYLGFAAVVLWVFALLFGSCGTCTCDACGDSGGGAGLGGCEGQAEEDPKEPGGCCLSSPLWMTAPLAVPRRPWTRTAHHPDHPDFAADVFTAAGRRWCVGCFTTIPVFVSTVLVLGLAVPQPGWATWLAVGLACASAQAWSTLGRARTRTAKTVVKALLGSGLGAIVHGVLHAPWAPAAQVGVLFATALLAAASAWPRARRMRAWSPA